MKAEAEAKLLQAKRMVAEQQAGPTGHCSPHHSTHCEPSYMYPSYVIQ
jgi:hypothetical protein